MSSTPLSPEAIRKLLEPCLTAAPGLAPAVKWDDVCAKLAVYLELLLKWNARVNLTAIREPEEIVRRHFGESLFAGLCLGTGMPDSCDSLLDLGSGAGFPGIPIQLLRPELPVTLAESRTKKAGFLREVARTLNLRTEVWAARAEEMSTERRFHTVTLRAVDDMQAAVDEAARRAARRVLILGTKSQAELATLEAEFALLPPVLLPNSTDGAVLIAIRR